MRAARAKIVSGEASRPRLKVRLNLKLSNYVTADYIFIFIHQ